MGNDSSKEGEKKKSVKGSPNYDDSLTSPDQCAPACLKLEHGKGKDKTRSSKIFRRGKGSLKEKAKSEQFLATSELVIPPADQTIEDETDALGCKKRPTSPGNADKEVNRPSVEPTTNDESGYVSDSFLLTDHEASTDFLGQEDNLESGKNSPTQEKDLQIVEQSPGLWNDVQKVMESHLDVDQGGTNKLQTVAEETDAASKETEQTPIESTEEEKSANKVETENLTNEISDSGQMPMELDQEEPMSTDLDQGNNRLTRDIDSMRSVSHDPMNTDRHDNENSSSTNQDVVSDDNLIIQSGTELVVGQNDCEVAETIVDNTILTTENVHMSHFNTSDNIPTSNFQSEEKMGDSLNTIKDQSEDVHHFGASSSATKTNGDEVEEPSDSLTIDQSADHSSEQTDQTVQDVAGQVTEEHKESPEQKTLADQDDQSRPVEDNANVVAADGSHVDSSSAGVDSHASTSSGCNVSATDVTNLREDAGDARPAAAGTDAIDSATKSDTVPTETNDANTDAENIANQTKEVQEETVDLQEVAKENNDVNDDAKLSKTDNTKSQDNVTPNIIVSLASVEEPDVDPSVGQPLQLEVLADPNSQQILAPEQASLERSQLAPGVQLRKSKRNAGSRHNYILGDTGQVAKTVAALVEEKEEEDNKNRKSVFRDDVLPGDITNINAIIEEDTGNTKLHVAALEFNAVAVKDCIKSGANVNKVNREYRNALHELVLSYVFAEAYDQAMHHKNFLEIVKALSAAQIDMNQTDLRGNTALHYVVGLKYQQETIKELLTYGCRINIGDNKNQTSLHVAVIKGDLETVQVLLDCAGDPNQADAIGQSSLHLAASGQHHAEITELLIISGALLELKDRGCRTPLHIAAKNGRLENTEVLLRHGASVLSEEGSGQTPLHLAAAKDPTEKVVDLLLKNLPKKDMKKYIDKKDSVYGDTALHKAVRHRRFETVKRLCLYKPNPNIRNNNQETSGHLAASFPDIGMWTKLANIGINFDITDNNGMTVIKKAIRMNNGVIVRWAVNFQEAANFQEGMFEYNVSYA